MLPYIEEGNLYNEFRKDEPWDSEHNKKLIERMPETYRLGIWRSQKYTNSPRPTGRQAHRISWWQGLDDP